MQSASANLLWLAAAGALAWFFPLTLLVVQLLSGMITLALRIAERQWR